MRIVEFLTSIGLGKLLGDCSLILIIAFTLIQISPLKINPWSWLWKKIGPPVKRAAKGVAQALIGDAISDLKERLIALEEYNKRQDEKSAESSALDARRRILQFADEVRRKVQHSEEHFNNIFEDINNYNGYCKTHENFENDKARLSIELIEEVYARCVKENSFL